MFQDDTFSIDENSANGSAVGTVIATDPDAGDSLLHSITAVIQGAFSLTSIQ